MVVGRWKCGNLGCGAEVARSTEARLRVAGMQVTELTEARVRGIPEGLG